MVESAPAGKKIKVIVSRGQNRVELEIEFK
jgi:hypothetical protein